MGKKDDEKSGPNQNDVQATRRHTTLSLFKYYDILSILLLFEQNIEAQNILIMQLIDRLTE